MNQVKIAMLLVMGLWPMGCSKSEEKAKPAPAAEKPVSAAPSNDNKDPAEASGAAKPSMIGGAHGTEIVELGSEKFGELNVRASRDKGEITPGADSPVDVWVTDGNGSPAKVDAVRLWIGAPDAKGSIKAKAEIENPDQPHHWHVHVEIPSPLPEASRLWVELDSKGAKLSGSFPLNP